jgi:hypothetical protein
MPEKSDRSGTIRQYRRLASTIVQRYFGTPARRIVYRSSGDLSIDEKHEFLDGYGLSSERLAEMAPLIKAFNILNYESAIAAAIEEDDQKTLSEITLRLNGTLDLFSLGC